MTVGDRYAPIVFKVLGVLALVILLASVVAGNDDHHADLAGCYRCEGVSADGGAYRGIVEIRRHADVYVVRWILESADSYTGIGVVNGYALAVTYVGGAQGVAAYTIEEGGRLVGEEPPQPRSAPFRRLPGLPVAGFTAAHAA